MKLSEINDLFLSTGSQLFVMSKLGVAVPRKGARATANAKPTKEKIPTPKKPPPKLIVKKKPVVKKKPIAKKKSVIKKKPNRVTAKSTLAAAQANDQAILDRLVILSLRKGKIGRRSRRLIKETKARMRGRCRELRWTGFALYKAKVWKETNSQPLEGLANFHLRAFKGWHVDHVLSISEGYKLGLPVETVGHISNLRMIPYEDNLSKNTKTVFTNLFNETV